MFGGYPNERRATMSEAMRDGADTIAAIATPKGVAALALFAYQATKLQI
jgi:hypothetical protein